MPFTIDLLNDDTRPKAPKIEGLTPAQRRHGRRLGAIHAMHLLQMAEVRRVLDEVGTRLRQPADAVEAIAGLDMTRNIHISGSICGQECRMLTFHHTAEDQWVFPALMGHLEGLTRVVERLAEEHSVIHAVIDRLQTCAEAAMQTPEAENFDELEEASQVLEAVVHSHFGYEQAELEEALGFFEVDL